MLNEPMNAAPPTVSTPAMFTFVKFVPWPGTATPVFTTDVNCAMAVPHDSEIAVIAAKPIRC